MKKVYTILFILLTMFLANAQNPVPNPGFELWSGVPGSPTGWTANNFSTNITIVQVPGHFGSGANGTVISGIGGVAQTPFLNCGTPSSGFPVSQRYGSMQCYLKSSLDSGDFVTVVADIFDSQANFISSCVIHDTVSIANFTLFAANFDSIAGGVPVFAAVFVTINRTIGGYAHLGSYFTIDDITLLPAVAGINEINPATHLQLFPNPTSCVVKINVKTNEKKEMNLLLSDFTGRIMLQRKSSTPVNGKIDDVLNLESLPRGVYSIMLSGQKENMVRILLVQ